MGVLVDDLLLLARLDQQRPLEREPVDLTHLARGGRSRTPGRPTRTGRTCSSPSRAFPKRSAHQRTRLHQVLANLLANVREHCPPGTTARVTVSTVSEATGRRGCRSM